MLALSTAVRLPFITFVTRTSPTTGRFSKATDVILPFATVSDFVAVVGL